MSSFPYSRKSLWVSSAESVSFIDQRYLPHELKIEEISSLNDAYIAIRDMQVRGAPLIGVMSAFAMFFACKEFHSDDFHSKLKKSGDYLITARPTAVNLEWAVKAQIEAASKAKSIEQMRSLLWNNANKILTDDIETCRSIGEHGLNLIKEIASKKKGDTVNVLTHCNAGRLACIEWGTATAAIYLAHQAGISIHVWVDETRPRNQGASLTAWELGQEKIPYHIITDNAGGHLMQHGMVDMVIVGTDRTTRTGDVANKIGTYLKALAAHDNHIPFYVAAPSSSIDWNLRNGVEEIPIEEREEDEVHFISGKNPEGVVVKVRITPEESQASNFGFDVTPARLITGIITERGVCKSDEQSLLKLFPEYKQKHGTKSAR